MKAPELTLCVLRFGRQKVFPCRVFVLSESLPEGRDQNLRFHDLRHDFASGLVQSGVAIHRINEFLRRGDISSMVIS
jgi:site-specific recombinase XerC